jgi:chromate reductase, NAD(P)H dehydrogenase (quinone)
MQPLNVLGICGSLRRFSTNKGLLRFAVQTPPEGVRIEIADLSEVPFYNADHVEKPLAVKALFSRMEKADAFLFACPEYNYSLAPSLKNALDWASREPKNYLLAGKGAAIMGSGGGMGTSRAQYHLRQVGGYLDLKILNKPEVFCNAKGGSFDGEGTLVDTRVQELVAQLLTALRDWAQLLR